MSVKTRKITSIRVVDPGSDPDVDTDFNTAIRDLVVEHTGHEYGSANQANITTFGRYGSKKAFKAMCTLYKIPFARANVISGLIPPPIEGVDCSIKEIFDPRSDRYSEGEDFRASTSGDEWNKIITGAMKLEGRVESVGVHACGVIMSQKPLESVIPLQVRTSDERVITQWTYPECESLGLLKMDFLGLDTVDIVQNSIEYIMKNGKTPPNMLDIVHGPLDDPDTFKLLQRGETIGIFQLSSPGVQDLLKKMKPTTIDDIAATTALFRPGPMGMLSHVRYAERKSGREQLETPVHEDFSGSALEKILGKTYNVVVFQEQVIQIASQIAGMTLQEGDDLRKAMGKKKIAIMNQMRPKFFDGSQKNGFSKEATERLWDTIAEFAKYGFNRAHSYSYALVAYQAAYLKANYPIEFMAALLAQNVTRKDKILSYLKEAKRMKLKVGGVNINTSDVLVAPDFKNSSKHDIVYGFSGVNGVSSEISKMIVAERTKNGDYTSIHEFIERAREIGITKKTVFENLAAAGAFDCFSLSRRGITEALPELLEESKTKAVKGESLFDMFSPEQSEQSSKDLIKDEEWDFADKLRHEANVIGLYLTSHPTEKLGKRVANVRSITIDEMMKSNTKGVFQIAGGITDTESKTSRRGGKSIRVSIDDGTGYLSAILGRNIVHGLNKTQAQASVKQMFLNGSGAVKPDLVKRLEDSSPATPALEKNALYTFSVSFKPNPDGPPRVMVNSMRRVHLDKNGNLPIRLRFDFGSHTSEDTLAKLKAKLPAAIAKKSPGKYSIMVSQYDSTKLRKLDTDQVYLDAVAQMEAEGDVKPDDAALENIEASDDSLIKSSGNYAPKRSRKRKGVASSSKNKDLREWPPNRTLSDGDYEIYVPHHEFVESLHYEDSGFSADKTNGVGIAIEKYLGLENYDFGAFDSSILE